MIVQDDEPIIVVQEFKQHHVEVLATLITKSFISLNRIWKHFDLPYDNVKSVIRGKILPTIGKLAFIMSQNGVVCAAAMQIEMIEYLTMPSMPNQIEFFQKLTKAGSSLENGLNHKQMQPGNIVYSMYAVIDPEYAKKGYSLRFWWQLFSTAKLIGFQVCYSRISSEVSLKMLQKLGAEVVAETEFVQGDLKQKIWMIKIKLFNPFPTYSMLKAMLKKSANPKSKL